MIGRFLDWVSDHGVLGEVCMVLVIVCIGLGGVWIMLATYALHLIFGPCFGWSGIKGCP